MPKGMRVQVPPRARFPLRGKSLNPRIVSWEAVEKLSGQFALCDTCGFLPSLPRSARASLPAGERSPSAISLDAIPLPLGEADGVSRRRGNQNHYFNNLLAGELDQDRFLHM